MTCVTVKGWCGSAVPSAEPVLQVVNLLPASLGACASFRDSLNVDVHGAIQCAVEHADRARDVMGVGSAFRQIGELLRSQLIVVDTKALILRPVHLVHRHPGAHQLEGVMAPWRIEPFDLSCDSQYRLQV